MKPPERPSGGGSRPGSSRSRGARRAGALLALVGALVIAGGPSAVASPGEQSASRILRELSGGKLSCGQASASDFERVGEYLMDRMLGTARGHEAMDRVMSTMMGAASERRVHEAMGRRFSGCGAGELPSGFGRMMGTVNAMGMMGGGMLGGAGQGGRFYGPGSMMGGQAFRGPANDDDGPSAGAMLGVMLALIGVVALGIWWFAGRRRPGMPLETLNQRYARGELSAEEYAERKRLLKGAGGP